MRYPGGKGRCYQHLISMMPPHRTYIETHLGGGAVLRHKRPAASTIGIERDARVIDLWRGIAAPSTTIVHGDALAFLRSFRFEGDELVYCDPPYPKETRARSRLYRYDYDIDDHVELLECIRGLPCMVMISSYDNELYIRALHDWRVIRFPGDSHTGPRTETAWLNFPEPKVLHDYSYCGADFRGREQIRRRRDGLLQRIGALSETERAALFGDLATKFCSEFRAAAEL